MAKVACKGTILKQDIASTLTAVAQVISISHDGAETETFDATTLDTSGAGKEYLKTGYTEGGSVDFELFFDPALAGHQAITDDITTPAERNWSLTFADTGASVWEFTGAGLSFGVTVDMADGLKANCSIKLDQLMSYDT